MTEDQDAKDSQSDSGSKTFTIRSKDPKKTKTNRPLTKIILRRLPPTMTEEAFLEQVSPIPEHDFFYFAKPDPSLGNNVFSRAYINFVNVEDIYLFRDKFDGYVFLDEKGVEYVGIVEYAPFQRIPKKKKKKDPKCGTIESDPIYQEFVENLNKDPETENQPKLEYSYPINDGNDKKVQTTPLLEYLASRKLDKRGRDERRRRENDKRKMRIERKNKEFPIKEDEVGENDIKKIKSRDWDKDKGNDNKEEKSKEDNIYESRTYREQKKASSVLSDKRKKVEKNDAKDDEQSDDGDKGYKRDKNDKTKESPRDQKSKKYSDSRKERVKQNDCVKSAKQTVFSKIITSDAKTKSNYDNIKPFTQLPQVKTDDLTKLIEGMDKKAKLEESNSSSKIQKEANVAKINNNEISDSKKGDNTGLLKPRRNSLNSNEVSNKEESGLKRQKSYDDRSEREESEEKEKSENTDRRTERRIRNKDRPSLVIYQPGMGKFSKQRLAKEKETQPSIVSPVNDSEKRDT